MYRTEHSLADFLPPTGYHAPMPQSIPQGLTRDHVLKALADLDAGIGHPFGKPTGYELVHGGKPDWRGQPEGMTRNEKPRR